MVPLFSSLLSGAAASPSFAPDDLAEAYRFAGNGGIVYASNPTNRNPRVENFYLSGMPADAVVERAFLWVTGASGNYPAPPVEISFNGVPLGWFAPTFESEFCYAASGSLYAVDVTSLVTGNGLYNYHAEMPNHSRHGDFLAAVYRSPSAPDRGIFVRHGSAQIGSAHCPHQASTNFTGTRADAAKLVLFVWGDDWWPGENYERVYLNGWLVDSGPIFSAWDGPSCSTVSYPSLQMKGGSDEVTIDAGNDLMTWVVAILDGPPPCDSPDPAATVAFYLDTDSDVTTDELPYYVPEGFDIVTLTSPRVRLVAKIDPSLAPCQTATFELFDTTNWKGYATNMGTSVGPDFQIDGSATVSFDSAGYATATLIVTDWGGYTRARVRIEPLGVMGEIEIPIDANDNWIADAEFKVTDGVVEDWIHDAVLNLDPCADDDPVPDGRGVDGDGLAAFDEYRGYIVRDNHRRTSPRIKDRFIAVEPPSYGFGYIDTLPTWDHWVHSGELHQLRYISVNQRQGCDPGGSPFVQVGIVVEVDEGRTPPNIVGGGYGATQFFAGSGCTALLLDGCYPALVDWCKVWAGEIRYDTPIHTFDPVSSDDPLDERAINKTLTHEVGHTSAVRHYSYPDTNPLPSQRHSDCTPKTAIRCDESSPPPGAGGPTSVMVSGFDQTCGGWAHPCCPFQCVFLPGGGCQPIPPPCPGTPSGYWTNLPVSYDSIDALWIRLRP